MLTHLLKGKLVKSGSSKMFVPMTFTWGPDHLSAFQQLEHDLLEGVGLKQPDYSNPFVLEMHAARGGLGAV